MGVMEVIDFADIKEGDRLCVYYRRYGEYMAKWATAQQDTLINDWHVDHPEGRYVNVKWDDVEYKDKFHPNDTIYGPDYSEQGDAGPYRMYIEGKHLLQTQWWRIEREKKDMTDKATEALARIKAAEAELVEARKALEEAKRFPKASEQLADKKAGTVFKLGHEGGDPFTVPFVVVGEGAQRKYIRAYDGAVFNNSWLDDLRWASVTILFEYK